MTTMLAKGTRALACLGGPWILSTITRCNEDGSFNVVPVGQEDSFMDEWEGLTRAELSVDDEVAWPAVFETLRGPHGGVGCAEVGVAFRGIGMEVEDDKLASFWAAVCAEQFPGRDSAGLVLDRDDAYKFFVAAGYSARLLGDPAADPSSDLFKLYWNQVRMGGRLPAEIDRTITIDDTVRVLGLDGAADDPAQVAALAGFAARHGVTLPPPLVRLWSKAGVGAAIRDSHCNNPEPVEVADWQLRRGEQLQVRIMTPHQGDHAWWARFRDGDPDAEIWLSFAEDGDPVRPVARSLAFFFWDLAETGRCWKLGADDDAADDDAAADVDN